MTDKRPQTEIDRLFPGESYKLADGTEVAVKPITFGKLKIFITAISSLMSKAAQAGIDNIEDPSQWPVIAQVAEEEVTKLMVAILNDDKYDEEWVRNLQLADAIGIFNLILEQNANEGTKKNIQALVETIKAVTPQSPSSSSSTDTAGEKSKT